MTRSWFSGNRRLSVRVVFTFLALLPFAWFLATNPLEAQKPHLRFYVAPLTGIPAGTYFQTVFQDRHDILWFGTSSGLFHFDGYRCRRQEIDAAHPALKVLDDITCLLEDQQKGFWVCTGFGVYRRAPGATGFEPVFRNKLPLDKGRVRIFAAACDRHGDLWFASPYHLFHWKARTGTWARVQPASLRGDALPEQKLRCMIAEPDGEIWIGTEKKGLFCLDTETRQVAACPINTATGEKPELTIHAIADGKKGRLWLATDQGLLLYDVADRQARCITPCPYKDTFTTVRVDHEDNIWVGSLNGSVWLRRKNEAVFTYHPVAAQPGGTLRERVYTIFEDRLGVIWIGHHSGVLYFDGRIDAFTHFRHDPLDVTTIPCSNVSRYLKDQRGGIWISSLGEGVFERQPDAVDFYRHPVDPADPALLSCNDVCTMIEDHGGQIWIGTRGGGLCRFDPEKRRFHVYRHDPDDPRTVPDNTVTALHVDQRDQLWIGTPAGLARYVPVRDDFEIFRVDGSGKSEKSSAVCLNAIAESKDGTIWVALTTNGLLRLTPDGKLVRHYRNDPTRPGSLNDDNVQTIHVAQNGMVWLKTTKGGLDRLDPATDRFAHFPDAHNRTAQGQAAIVEDADGFLWITHRFGLLEFNPDTGEFVNHARTLSIPQVRFVRGVVGHEPDGTVYLADRHGMNAFHAERFKKAQDRPRLILMGIEVLGRPLATDRPLHDLDRITLSYEQRLITFSFAVTDYANPPANTFRYQLEGVDQDWVQSDYEPRATYANLDPGPYTFRAQGAGGDGVWSPDTLTLEVVVEPAYWHTWWFRLAMASAVLGLLVLIATWRHQSTAAHRREVQLLESQIRHVQKLESLGVLAGGFAHDFNNLLTGILANASHARRRTHADASLARPLAEIEDAARRAEELTGQMLAYAGKGEAITTAINLSARVREATSLLRASMAKNASLVFRLAADLPLIEGDPGQIQQVIMNLITNASDALEGQPGTIVLETDVKDFQRDDLKGAVLGHDFQAGRYVFLRVTDQGTGMSEETLSRIFDPFFTTRFTGRGLGLAAVLGILHQHGAAIQIQTAPGQGSAFTVLFPCPGSPLVAPSVPLSPQETSPPESSPPKTEVGNTGKTSTQKTRSARSRVTASDTSPAATVLVVDDEPLIRFAASSALEDGGMAVVSAPDGETALRHLDARDSRFDAVVLDLTMPGLSGAETHAAIRQRRPDLPVVLVSGYSEVEAAPMLNSGPTTFLKKPFTSDALIMHVREALRRQKSLLDSDSS